MAASKMARFQQFRRMRNGCKKDWPKNLLLGMCMGLALYGGSFAISLWTKSEVIIEVPPISAIWQQLVLFGFGTFFSSFSEDVLTRGYIYMHIGHKTSPTIFILISSVIYLLNHIYRLDDGVETLLYIFLLGVLFSIPVVLTKRLWFTGGMHWIGNATFFYTHSIINIKEGNGGLSPNTLFIIYILLFTPLTFLLLRSIKTALQYSGNSTTQEKGMTASAI